MCPFHGKFGITLSTSRAAGGIQQRFREEELQTTRGTAPRKRSIVFVFLLRLSNNSFGAAKSLHFIGDTLANEPTNN